MSLFGGFLRIVANLHIHATKYVKMHFIKGFKYMGKSYGWHENTLYRLPYDCNNRYYNLLQCSKWSTRGYYLGAHRKSHRQIESMATNIDVFVKVYENEMPF